MTISAPSALTVVAVILIAGLAGTAGCAQNRSHDGGQDASASRAIGDSTRTIHVFANKAFYQERTEPEEVFRGILRFSPVRAGPDTRDMPYTLVLENEELDVYSSGLDDGVFEQFVGREVVVQGKRVDLRHEGFGIEIWIATIVDRRR